VPQKSGLLILLLLLAAATAATAQQLPMPPGTEAPPTDLSWWASLMAWMQAMQGDLWRGLAKAIKAVKQEGSLSAASWLLGVSFLYGVLHAAGPGHGKAIIGAYLVGNESAIRRGIALSFLSAAAQGVTAIVLVGVLAAILGFISREVASVATWLEMASAIMIVLLGAWIAGRVLQDLYRRWRPKRGPAPQGNCNHDHGGHDHHHDHAPGHHHHHAHAHAVVTPQQALDLRQGLAIVAAIGARPCMGSIFVLLFALAQGVFALGVLATVAISLGTAITVSVLAILATSARVTALRVAGSMDGWMRVTTDTLSLLAGAALVLLGIALLFQPAAPFPGAG
jgi:nickel/cobalt exporter